MPLRVVIVGAGIAGLSAAVSLRRVGHIVDVFERSSFANEIGAAINVPPNASRPLLRWGLNPAAAKFVQVEEVAMHDPITLRAFQKVPVGDFVSKKFGAPFYFAHRVDLHEELKRMAADSSVPGVPVNIHLKSGVLSYDPSRPSIRLASGQQVEADLVVAADGVHSEAAQVVSGEPGRPQLQKHYNSCYRFLIPSADLYGDPQTAPFLDGNDGKMSLFTDNQHRRRLVCYPCRNNEVQNFVGIFHNDAMDGHTKQDWHARASRTDMLKTFEGFHPTLLRVLSKATEVKCWPLLSREPLKTWTRGKLVLAGDAAHPMLPHQGQGGAQAIEDGVALGAVLQGAQTEDVSERLAAYEAIRMNRASAIQVMSNAGQDQIALTQQEAAKYIDAGEKLPKNPQEFTEYNFGHDVEEAALRFLRHSIPASNLASESQILRAHG